ncbi:class I SAM-dependent methyltransferase [Vulcanisaeta souniana]|uniref:SAM-dependent methyltransferase n=1 Tax=Vulcanisaeta souniana JCM 11219 TaxID=1293586 RepID=A0A830E018_9CREN|nr:class I SAM-dependent methyltransferase [Vulcanisaeta souniana]BDR91481.1 SAM-dependent methyltransferase [Vulcanisaeta souniana JCM 11219]GGI73475.1 SAM-dependent methyltransferase [Vulcanisaeta souniana JCM 11219]
MVSNYGYFEQFDERFARMYRFFDVLLIWSYRLTANILNRLVKPPAKILEVGPGTGRLANILSNRGYHVVGVDVSLPMLRQARRFWRPDFVNAGSWAIPTKPGRFDAAVAMFTLHHWGDHASSIRNVYDSLRSDSVFIVAEANADRIGTLGSHSCSERCLVNVLTPYFNVNFIRSFPLIIAIGKKLK